MASSARANVTMNGWESWDEKPAPIPMNELAELMLHLRVELPDSPYKYDSEDESEPEDEDAAEYGRQYVEELMVKIIWQFGLWMFDISIDPLALGTEKGTQLYKAMRTVGLEDMGDTTWAIQFITKEIYAGCLFVTEDLHEQGQESFGTKKELRLWYKGMIGYLEGKVEEFEGDVSESMESDLEKESQTDSESHMY